jgi:C1A family cysteine protease
MPIATPMKVNNLAVIFDIGNPDQSMDRARRLLRAGVPIVMTFGVQPSLLSNKIGYVPSPSEAERYVGGQAALISGFVPNHLRPPGAPEATGGGYFIMKNSWGRCAGDAGYYYLPADWVRANAFNLTAVF